MITTTTINSDVPPNVNDKPWPKEFMTKIGVEHIIVIYIDPMRVSLLITASIYFDVCSPGLTPVINAPERLRLSAVSFGLKTNPV
jgi:hypothetical protein